MYKRASIVAATLGLLASGAAFAQATGNQVGNTMKGGGDVTTRNSDGTTPTWEIVDVLSTGCTSGAFGFNTIFENVTAPAFAHTEVDLGGVQIMDEQFNYIDAFGAHTDARPDDWFLFDDNGSGLWPIPDDTPLTILFQIRDGLDGNLQFQREVVIDGCNTGNITSNTILVGKEERPLAVPSMGRTGTLVLTLSLLLLGGIAVRRMSA